MQVQVYYTNNNVFLFKRWQLYHLLKSMLVGLPKCPQVQTIGKWEQLWGKASKVCQGELLIWTFVFQNVTGAITFCKVTVLLKCQQHGLKWKKTNRCTLYPQMLHTTPITFPLYVSCLFRNVSKNRNKVFHFPLRMYRVATS